MSPTGSIADVEPPGDGGASEGNADEEERKWKRSPTGSIADAEQPGDGAASAGNVDEEERKNGKRHQLVALLT